MSSLVKPQQQNTSIVKDNKISFSFSDLKQLSFNDANNDSKFFIDFLDRLSKLSDLSWDTINRTARHSFGTEKMPVSQLSKSAQNLLHDDVDSLLVFRANGDNRPFLGYRVGNVFQIVFIEYKYGDNIHTTRNN